MSKGPCLADALVPLADRIAALDGASREIAAQTANFVWHLPDDWMLQGSFGCDGLRQMPSITLYRARRDENGDIDVNKCYERFTPFSPEFSSKLSELMAAVEKRRDL